MLAPTAQDAIPAQLTRGVELPAADALDAIDLEKRELGRELKKLRRQMRKTQEDFGRLIGYKRVSVSNAETGLRSLSRDFWAKCDEVLKTGTRLADWHDRICYGDGSEEPGPADTPCELRFASKFKSQDPAVAQEAYVRLGWPVTTERSELSLLTGRAVDVLEVPFSVGALGARWWIETGGREDAVRGLPALPRPGLHLAVISTGTSCYFLVRAGQNPWPATPSRSTAARRHPAHPGIAIIWHAGGSQVPVPPGGSGTPASWMFLPSRAATFRLPPPHAVAYLLGRAAAAAPTEDAFTLPGGALVMPPAASTWPRAAGE